MHENILVQKHYEMREWNCPKNMEGHKIISNTKPLDFSSKRLLNTAVWFPVIRRYVPNFQDCKIYLNLLSLSTDKIFGMTYSKNPAYCCDDEIT